MTYMAKCTNGCANFKGDSGTPWVKIDHFGWDPKQTPAWGSDRLAAQGASWTVTIPKSISNGEYLLRHEILGLHVAGTAGGAQVCRVYASLGFLELITVPHSSTLTASRSRSLAVDLLTRLELLFQELTPPLNRVYLYL